MLYRYRNTRELDKYGYEKCSVTVLYNSGKLNITLEFEHLDTHFEVGNGMQTRRRIL
jgi:hypothetical protein